MATFSEASEKLRALSGQVSTIVRTLSLGVLAVAWLFLSGNKDLQAMAAVVPKWLMLAIAAACVIALALDLLQYVLAYNQVSADYEAAKKSNAGQVTYHPDKFREVTFNLKVWFAVGASVALVGALFWAAVKEPAAAPAAPKTEVVGEVVPK